MEDEDDDFLPPLCPICGDASDSCNCFDDEEEEEMDDSWFTDPEEGAR